MAIGDLPTGHSRLVKTPDNRQWHWKLFSTSWAYSRIRSLDPDYDYPHTCRYWNRWIGYSRGVVGGCLLANPESGAAASLGLAVENRADCTFSWNVCALNRLSGCRCILA